MVADEQLNRDRPSMPKRKERAKKIELNRFGYWVLVGAQEEAECRRMPISTVSRTTCKILAEGRSCKTWPVAPRRLSASQMSLDLRSCWSSFILIWPFFFSFFHFLFSQSSKITAHWLETKTAQKEKSCRSSRWPAPEVVGYCRKACDCPVQLSNN